MLYRYRRKYAEVILVQRDIVMIGKLLNSMYYLYLKDYFHNTSRQIYISLWHQFLGRNYGFLEKIIYRRKETIYISFIHYFISSTLFDILRH